MQNLLTNKTVSLTELRDPNKVIKNAGDRPVAVLNRNKLVGYFVPSTAVDNAPETKVAATDEVKAALAKTKQQRQPVLDYLKDK